MFRFLCLLALFGVVVSSPALQLDDLKIVGGDDIEITDAPYQVSLVEGGRHACGGSIVANDIIVTAAHCVTGTNARSYLIRVGSSYSQHGGELYPVSDMIIHPGFTYSTMDHDVAVLLLAIPLKFSQSVMPIRLAEQDEEISDGELTIVTGWGNIREGGGYPTKLQKVLVPIINAEVCVKAYFPAYSVTPRMLCAGVPEGGKDACQGDSGGPMVHENKLTGIVSWGLGCARPDYPGVYAKVSTLRTWIDTNIMRLRLRNASQ